MTQLSPFSLQASYLIVGLLSAVLLGGIVACAALAFRHHVLATRGHPAQRWFRPRYGRQLNPEAVHANKAAAWACAIPASIAALVGLHMHLNQEFWPLALHGVLVEAEVSQLTHTARPGYRAGAIHTFTVVGLTTESSGEALAGLRVRDTVSRQVFGRLHERQRIPFVVFPDDPSIHQVGAEASLRWEVVIGAAYAVFALAVFAALARARR